MRSELAQEMKFGSNGANFAGPLSGVALAMGVPWVLLRYGGALGDTTTRWLVISTIAMGCATSFISAVLALVMPNQIDERPSWAPHVAPAPLAPTSKDASK